MSDEENRQVGGQHYQGSGLQPFDVIDAWGLDFYLGSALKYIMRAGKKDGVKASEDLRKAEHYLSEAADRAESTEGLEDLERVQAEYDAYAELAKHPDPDAPKRTPRTGSTWTLLKQLNGNERFYLRVHRVDTWSAGDSSNTVIQYKMIQPNGDYDNSIVYSIHLKEWYRYQPVPLSLADGKVDHDDE